MVNVRFKRMIRYYLSSFQKYLSKLVWHNPGGIYGLGEASDCMISYAVYKIVHLVGVLMVFLALGGVATNAINGGAKNHSWRKAIAITHGVGLLLSLVGGFGLLARLGIVHGGLPGWVFAKLGVWILFAALIGVVSRKPTWAKVIWTLLIVLGGTAAYLAGSKPF